MSGENPASYQVPDDILAAHLAGEAVLLDMETKQYYRLNETAAHVWKGLERGMDREALLDDLVTSFEVDRQTAGDELDRLIGELSTRRLVRPGSGDETA